MNLHDSREGLRTRSARSSCDIARQEPSSLVEYSDVGYGGKHFAHQQVKRCAETVHNNVSAECEATVPCKSAEELAMERDHKQRESLLTDGGQEEREDDLGAVLNLGRRHEEVDPAKQVQTPHK